MTTIPSDKEYRAVQAILGDSGFSVRDLRTGQYDAMVDAIIYGDEIAISKGADGKADIKIGGVDATSPIFKNVNRPDDCPDWIPAALCSGYSKITSNLPSAPNAGAVLGSAAKMAGYTELGDKLEEYGARITFIIIGLVLLGIGIYFSVSGSVKSTTIDIASKVLTK